MPKQRLDTLMVAMGLTDSREQARGLILSGLVWVNGKRIDKAGHPCPMDADISVKKPLHNYVSRGGLKLEKAIDYFRVDVTGKTVLDVGASTGGFTDCALQRGARHVFAVDVGSGQLAWKLRNDPRVTAMEKTNIRYVKREELSTEPELAVIDVSFISLCIVLPVVQTLLAENGEVVALIKPQFEAGRELASKGKGIIRDAHIHVDTICKVLNCALALDFSLYGLTHSPITGPEGNMEFIAWWKADGKGTTLTDHTVADVVREAHKEFTGSE